jgi:hypothetical protein
MGTLSPDAVIDNSDPDNLFFYIGQMQGKCVEEQEKILSRVSEVYEFTLRDIFGLQYQFDSELIILDEKDTEEVQAIAPEDEEEPTQPSPLPGLSAAVKGYRESVN